MLIDKGTAGQRWARGDGIHAVSESVPPLSPTAEADLVRRAKALDPAAWASIYESYYPVVFRYMKARVFDQATAEDLTSGVFLAAVTGIAGYRERGKPLLAWLYGISRNQVAQHHRQTGRRQKRELRLPDSGEGAEQQPDVRSSATSKGGDPEEAAERLDLLEAIDGLTDEQREVVILRFFGGLSAQEVAAAMGKTPVAIYSLEARALNSLRSKLD